MPTVKAPERLLFDRRSGRRLDRDEEIDSSRPPWNLREHGLAESAEKSRREIEDCPVGRCRSIALRTFPRPAKSSSPLPLVPPRVEQLRIRECVVSCAVERHCAGQAAGLRQVAIRVVEEIDVPEQVLSAEAGRSAGIEILSLDPRRRYRHQQGATKKENRSDGLCMGVILTGLCSNSKSG